MSKNDQEIRLKYMGYVLGTAAPETKPNFEDFINFCKFKLCVLNHKLVKDPIWDRYTSEEIILEYYAHQFQNEEYRKQYESGGDLESSDEFFDWATSEMDKNKMESKEIAVEKISFNPAEILDVG